MKISVFGTMEEVISIHSVDNGTYEVEVICDNGRHKISVDRTGKLKLHNHSEEDQLLSQLAGDDTTCIRVKNQLSEWAKNGQLIW